MALKSKTPYPLALLGGIAALFAFTASECEMATEFPPLVQEICTDNQDNDDDAQVDCDDFDCNVACQVNLVIFAPPATISSDTLRLNGTVENATSVSVSPTPEGIGGSATLTGNNWTFLLTNIIAPKDYRVNVVATSAKGRKDTASVNFSKR